ncbi:hypothetical protein [Actibacterium lipolyticum]|uniref:Uncharacterized protein n=1 Tax=Actibacterium lipolyticum TaxID=1524263 RepID=A0A238JN08_9RHOB|nr:hypothetical protein [Actibacterium lipolyticum]SMX32049.1 hypothetical protein COL8621_00694 [Actibacterium lipolyticum]
MAEVTVKQLADEISELMEERLGVGGHDLAAKIKRAGRLLPRHVRRDAEAVAQAVPMAKNPKLMKQIDLPRLEAAERRVVSHLKTVDRAERRKDAVLGLLGSISFSLIAVFALLVTVLVWQGFL